MSKLKMRAYYHTFKETGEVGADRILSAVASAGKSAHHTADWGEEWDNIQNAAVETATEINALMDRLAEAEKKISEWEAAPDFVKAGDGTLHGAIDYWQNKAIEYKDKYLASLEERANLQQHIQSALDLIEIEGPDTDKLIKLLRGSDGY